MKPINHNPLVLFTFVLFLFSSTLVLAQVDEDFESGIAGWTSSGTAATGTFIWGNPDPTTYQLGDDHTIGGVNAVFTGFNPGGGLGTDDVDGGTATITSPVYSVANASTLSIWYFFGQRDNGDDAGDFFSLEYSLNGGTSYTTLVFIGDTTTNPNWTEATVQIPAGSDVRVRVNAADGNSGGDIIEAGIDDLTITPMAPALEISDTTIDEGAGTVDFVVTTTNIAASGPFTAFYQTNNGSATGGGVDYFDVSGSLSFSGALNESQTVTVTINDDSDVEFDENFQFQVTHTSIGTVDVSDLGLATITDNDTIIIANGDTVNVCDGSFFDSGGSFGQYGFNEDSTFTICPDSPVNDININFASFDVEAGFDFLRVYQGTSTAGTLIGTYSNSNPPPTNITSLDASGCLTFRFTSDNIQNQNGWEGIISCISRGPRIMVDDIAVDEDAGTMIFTVTHDGISASAPFTVTYNTVNGTATAGTDYTGITGGTLNFDGTLGDSDTITVSIADDLLYEVSENFTIEFITSTDPLIDITDTAIGTIDDNEIILDNTELVLIEELDGYIGYTSTGGSLRTQDNSTDACSITTSSSNTLTSEVPAGASISKAFLYWAHSSATPDSQVTFEGNTVDADLMYTTALTGGRIFYGGVSDVTSIVAGIADPTTNSFDFSGLTVDNSATYCNSATVLGGWSLIVFFEDPSLPASTVNLYQGFHGESSTTSTYTLDGFFAIGASGSKTTILSWEGDQNLNNNEALEFTTGSGSNDLVGDGDNTTGSPNPFNSTIFDNTGATTVNITTSYGVDLDTYDVSPFISAGESTATTRVESGQDFVILNAVVLKVPSNLVTGNVFEDVNYGGGFGRDLISSSGVPIEGVDLELYDNTGSLIQTASTDASGVYVFGGMANGDYTLRTVNNTIRSTRIGGATCTNCLPVQTFKTDYIASVLVPDTNSVGGENPSGEDPSAGTLIGAQSISSMTILNEGVVGMDFGFNFNTIVNTNANGQGSLGQFIVNSNTLDNSSIDIVANSIFDPAPGDDTSIFMIPSASDVLGRTPDPNFSSGYFNINIPNGSPLAVITGDNTKIDGRTQTAYSGDTNTGTVGSGGTSVGTSAIILPNYDRPEIQLYRGNGNVLRLQGNAIDIRSLSVYANQNSGIRIDNGSANIEGNLIGVNALGNDVDNIVYGVEVNGGMNLIDGNYISANDDAGILIDGGTATSIQNNHVTTNGAGSCDDNITLQSGSGIVIQQNLIENAASLAIDGDGISGNVTILENTIISSGQDGGTCTGNIENAGILLDGSNSSISNNIIASNGGPGIVLAGGITSGNLISQNSIYANGTAADALGIDLDLSDNIGDGVTLNDTGDADSGPNGGINFPVITNAYKSGSNVVVSGWSRPGATIEFFLTDINEGTALLGDNQLGLSADYGEGQVFLASLVEGSGDDTNSGASFYLDDDNNTDNTNKFTFTFPVSAAITLGEDLTATATIANSTSEFSPFSKLKAFTVITNRRITYRVKKD